MSRRPRQRAPTRLNLRGRVVAAVLAAGLSPASGSATLPRIDHVVDVDLVLVPVFVLDRDGRAVTSLAADDFVLEVDGRRTPIESFARGESPFSVAIVIDCSASMVGERFVAARRAAGAFLERMQPGDRATLIGFDHRPRTWAALDGDRAVLLAALDRMHTGGGTAMLDALRYGIEALEREAGRKAIVLLSDGEDVLSQQSVGAVERAARRSDVVLYTFRMTGEIGDPAPSGNPVGKSRLSTLADDLGGRAFAPATTAELVAGYATVFEEMRLQYTLGFVPTPKGRRKWHTIEVDVSQADVRVRARRGWLSD